MRYAVRALEQGGIVSLTLEADDAAAVRRQLAERQLQALSVRAVAGAWPRVPQVLVRREHFPLALFTQELLALLEAGLTLTEALEALCDKETRTATRSVIERLLTALRSGKKFSLALAEQPAHFPALYVGMLRAAEQSGAVPAALSRYLEYRSRLDGLRARLVSALLYPIILAVVGAAVTAFLLGHVVPRFAAVYQGTGRSLPWLSEQLLAWGGLVTQHGPALGWAMLTLVVAGVWGGRRWWRAGGPQRLLRRLPGVAPTVATLELARLYLALGTLLSGGLPILPALRLAEGVLAADTRLRYRAAAAGIDRGESCSAAFAQAGLATPVALRLMRVGERGGRLGEMLERAARFHDSEVARRIDLFARGFEPLLMVAIGGLVGTIVVLLYLPIFDLAGSLQ